MGNMLSYIIFIPLIAATVILALPKKLESSYKWVTLGATGLTLILAIIAMLQFDATKTGTVSSEETLLN